VEKTKAISGARARLDPAGQFFFPLTFPGHSPILFMGRIFEKGGDFVSI
jgi:hypothetical protein